MLSHSGKADDRKNTAQRRTIQITAAQENVQPLLNGEMTGEEYMQSIQDVYDMQ